MNRWLVILVRADDCREVLSVMHHTRPEAELCARAWLDHYRGQIGAEVVAVEIPEAGEAVEPKATAKEKAGTLWEGAA